MKRLQGFLLLFLLLPFVYSLEASVKETEITLEPDYQGGLLEIPQSINVKNVNDIPVKVSLFVFDLRELIEIKDKEVVLEQGETAKMDFIVHLTETGTYKGKIITTFSPVDPNISETSAARTTNIVITADGTGTEVYEETPTVEVEETAIEPVPDVTAPPEPAAPEIQPINEPVEPGLIGEPAKPELINEPELIAEPIANQSESEDISTLNTDHAADVYVGLLTIIGIVIVGLLIYFFIAKL